MTNTRSVKQDPYFGFFVTNKSLFACCEEEIQLADGIFLWRLDSPWLEGRWAILRGLSGDSCLIWHRRNEQFSWWRGIKGRENELGQWGVRASLIRKVLSFDTREEAEMALALYLLQQEAV